MVLKAVIAKLEDAEESVRGLYAPGTEELEGKFVLQVEASEGLQLAPVQKLQNALQAARHERDDAVKRLKGYQDDEGNPVDIETLRRAEQELKALKEGGSDDDKKRIAKLEEQLKGEYSRREKELADKFNAERQGFESRNKSLQSQLHQALLVSQASKAILDLDGEPDVLMPHIERQVKAEEIDGPDGPQVKYYVIDPKTGHKRIGTAAGSSEDMTLEELVSELKGQKAFQGCFKAPNSGTAPRGSNSNTTVPVGDNMNPVESLKQARRAAD